MARPIKHDGNLYKRQGSTIWWMRYRDKEGIRQRESTLTDNWEEAQKVLRERLQARDNNTLPALRRGRDLAFGEWSDFYLENFSKPPFRAPKSHEVNARVLKRLRKGFETTKLAEFTADDIEMYLRRRLKQRALVKTKNGFVEKHVLKATTVHQELRVLRRMLNVAVRKKFLFANPCAGVEFPARIEGLFRPHYVTWSEQQKIEFAAPEYLRNVIRIVTETGLRIYKELTPLKKEQLDLENRTVWIPDSKTPNGVAEVPLTDIAADAFRNQLAISGTGPFLFPSEENPEVGIAPGERLHLPLLIHNATGKTMDVTLSATVPHGWTIDAGQAVYSISAHDTYSVQTVLGSQAEKEPAWQTVVWNAESAGKTVGTITMRVNLTAGGLPQ